MRIKYAFLAFIGLLVAVFYLLESVLSFQADGFTAVLLVKLAICGTGIYFFARSIRQINSQPPVDSTTPQA